MNRFAPYVIFSCLSVFIGLGAVFIEMLFPFNLALFTRLLVLILFFCVAALSHFILEGKIKDGATGDVRTSMLMETLKHLIFAFGLKIGAFHFKGKTNAFILFYAVTYLFFLIGEQV